MTSALTPEPPDEIYRRAAAAFQAIAGPGAQEAVDFDAPHSPVFELPHRRFVLPFAALADPEPLLQAKAVGWRLIVTQEGKVIASVDVNDADAADDAVASDGDASDAVVSDAAGASVADGAATEPRFGPALRASVVLTARRMPVGTAKVMARLHEPSASRGLTEIRSLQVSALRFSCLWAVGEQDQIVPLRHAPSYLEAERQYTAEEFFETIRRADPKPFTLPAAA